MKHRKLFSVAAVLLVLLSCCSRKEETSSTIIIPNKVTERITPEEYKINENFGTLLIAGFKEEKIPVKLYPSPRSETVATLSSTDTVVITGVSKDLVNTTQSFRWYRVRHSNEKDSVTAELGWIHGGSVDTESIVPEEIVVDSFLKETENSGAVLTIKTGSTASRVYLYKTKIPGEYTFAWSDDQPSFRYNHIPGTYVYNSETHSIEHVSYLGYELESGDKFFDSERRYFFQDFGTGPGIRAIGIYEVATSKEVFSGQYYQDLNYDGKTITIAVPYSEYYLSEGTVDEESKKHAEEFISTVSGPTPTEVVVIYRLNLEDRKRTFLEVIDRSNE